MNASAGRPHVYRFGVFELDTLAHQLRKQGAHIRLQDQPYQILLLLLGSAGKVVTRDELRQVLWPSSVYVDFDHGLNNAIARLRETLGDAAAAPRFIETIPRLGYRFIYPVADSTPSDAKTHEPPLDVNNTEHAPQQPMGTTPGACDDDIPPGEIHRSHASRWTYRRLIGVGMFAAVTALGLLAALWPTQRVAYEAASTAAMLSAPSVAVLPFVSMSSDRDNEYFADGLSQELLSKLAGIRGLKVASQTSSFHFKGRHKPAAVIARALQVNHLLEGSVRRSGTRVRITAQLIDARDGYQRWSQTFDRDFTDIFQIQEDIALAVANALQVKLLAADEERLRNRGTGDPEAYRHYLIARAQISWVYGKPDWLVIKRSYEEAIARDPDFAAAYAGLAHYYYNREADEEGVRLGRAAAERAVALDPELSEALGARANFEFLRYHEQGDFRAYALAHSDFRRALELDPSNAQAAFHYARAVHWYEPGLALELFERTFRLDPMRYSAVGFSALMMSRQGQHDAARARAQALYDGNPGQKFW